MLTKLFLGDINLSNIMNLMFESLLIICSLIKKRGKWILEDVKE